MHPFEHAANWPVDTVAAGVTDANATLGEHGETARVFPFASVTKPLAAYAFLVAIDHGRVDLDEPAGPDGATVRHLLAHAGGYDFDSDRLLAEPGERRIYSNTGFEVLGELVEQRVGRPLPQFLRQQVLLPLGMSDTTLDGSPAAGAEGTVEDLLRFGRELLDPTLLDPDLYEEATTVVFPGLDGVLPGFGRQEPNDWGLGFEIKDGKEPHWTGSKNSPATLGHFGQSGSFLWVDPDAELACAALGSEPFGDWAREAWPLFSDAVLDEFGQ
ncbi:MAG: serine hydrolase domain-containing protein [Nitriliruptorales bacterium]|nr:serine hydrolase domain-containing protein [Nitriliruptorales bacterium]